MRHLWVIIVTACTDEKSAIVSRDLAAEREGIQVLSTDISAYLFPFVENLTAIGGSGEIQTHLESSKQVLVHFVCLLYVVLVVNRLWPHVVSTRSAWLAVPFGTKGALLCICVLRS